MSELELDSQTGVKELLRLIEDLKFFLATAPANWQENQVIRRYYLNHDEGFVLCVYWNNLYFITGTDIVRCIVYKFEHFGRKIIDRKKFEEGIFLDLRALKCGTDAILEPPRSDFLSFLFKNACLRTQKKQKVFFWFNVPHDKLMADALERDLKKEKLNQPATTVAHREPALSFTYDDRNPLFQQLVDHMDTQQLQLPAEDTTNDSPEYLERPVRSLKFERSHLVQGNTAFQGLTGGITTEEDSYENDFPLDYFETSQMVREDRYPNDYVNIDAGGSFGIEEQFDRYIDPLVFEAPSSQLVFNNEYLIEQTQAVKPGPKHTSQRIVSSKDDFFPLPQPLSAKNQQHFIRQPYYEYQQPPVVGPLVSIGSLVPQTVPGYPSGGYGQQMMPMGAPIGAMPTMAPAMAPHLAFYETYADADHWAPYDQQQPLGVTQGGYIVMDGPAQDHGMYQAIPVHHPIQLAAPSARQNAISNMMKRKRQERFGITKPGASDRRSTEDGKVKRKDGF